uniref:putative ribosome biogenesis protein C8F11.04 n=1 Tax=Erigeron canadensis TaxID=72917 RepID=UPI001CB9B02A|nr:putative ribosome biogenesis protein C8F11.04 [Erigeron canadensis]
MAAAKMMIPATTTEAAIDSLLKWKKKRESDSGKAQLLPEDDSIYLILTLQKIPSQKRVNPNKLPLPHPLYPPSSAAEICLIIDDRPSSNLTSKSAKQKIRDEAIPVTKVIKLSKLKTDYKPFESKRKLCDSYDLFFADKRVIPLLPKLLGKQFFKKKKLPLGVDLTHNNWKEQIERGCSSGLLFFRTGTCCVIRVAKVSMERDQIVENVSAAVEGAIELVPKKLLGVRSLHLKFSDSVSLPLYQSLPDIKLRIEGAVKDQQVAGMEVGSNKKSKKARIHQVATDVLDEVENGDSSLVEEKPSEKTKDDLDDGGSGKKKRKGNVVEVENKKKSKKVVEVNHDLDVEQVENNEPESVEEAKVGKKSVKDKKRKGNVVEEDNVKTKSSEKKPKKKGEKQIGDSTAKKEKRKGRSVSRVSGF